MKLNVKKNTFGFFISLDNYVRDKKIAEYLDLSLEEYQAILIKHNTILYAKTFYPECFFKNEKDAQKALKVLEPYEILAKLTE